MTSRVSRVHEPAAPRLPAGPAVPRLVCAGATGARWLVCAFLAVSAVFGAWYLPAPEAHWPLWSVLVDNPPAPVLAAAGLLALGICAALEWQRVHRVAYAGRPRLVWASIAMGLSCGLLLALAVAAAPGARSPEAAWKGAARLAVALAAGLLAWLSRPRPRDLAPVLGLAASVHALIGIAQFALQSNWDLTPVGGLSGFDAQSRAISVIEAGGTRWLRAYGLSAHPNVLGGFLVVATLVMLGALASGHWSRRGRIGLFAALGLSQIALLLSFSRSAWIGLACGLGVLAWFRWRYAWPGLSGLRGRERWVVLAAIVAIAATGAGVSPLIATRLTGAGSLLEVRSIEERRFVFTAGWELFLRSPFRGTGLDNSAQALRDFLHTTYDETGTAYVHNVALMAALELGAGGGLIWIALGAAGVLVPWLALRRGRARGGGLDGWAAALGAAWLAVWVIALFDYYPWLPLQNGVIWPALAGLWMATWPGMRQAPAA